VEVRVFSAAPFSITLDVQPIEMLHFMCLHMDWCATK